MARLAVVSPSGASGRLKELFDGPLKGKHFNLFKGLANSPAALGAYVGASGALSSGLLTRAEQEAVQLAVSEANRCGYCVAAHTALGKLAGLSESETIGARRGGLQNPRLESLVKFVRALHEKRGFVSDEDLTKVRAAGFGDGHIAEAVAGYALAVFTNYFNHVNGTEVDFPAAPAA